MTIILSDVRFVQVKIKLTFKLDFCSHDEHDTVALDANITKVNVLEMLEHRAGCDKGW